MGTLDGMSNIESYNVNYCFGVRLPEVYLSDTQFIMNELTEYYMNIHL